MFPWTSIARTLNFEPAHILIQSFKINVCVCVGGGGGGGGGNLMISSLSFL